MNKVISKLEMREQKKARRTKEPNKAEVNNTPKWFYSQLLAIWVSCSHLNGFWRQCFRCKWEKFSLSQCTFSQL